MAYQYHLRTSSLDRPQGYATFAEASQAIATSVAAAGEWWELVRTSDRPDAWTSVLSGAGPNGAGTRHTSLRHYLSARP